MSNDHLFKFAEERKVDNEQAQGSSLSFWKDARKRFFKNKASKFALILFLFIIAFAVTAPFLGAYHNEVTSSDGTPDPNWIGEYQNPDYANLPPKIPGLESLGIADGIEDGVDVYAEAGVPEDMYFFFGTDDLGRDLYVRTGVAVLVSLAFGLIAAFIDIVIGVVLGCISGYHGGKVDLFLQRVAEVLGTIPALIWVIIIVMYFGSGFIPLVVAITISGWIPMYRIVRSQVMKLKNQEFVLSSKTLGGKSSWIITKHIIPNTLGVIIIWLMFTIPSAIFFESFLSFLGLGIAVPIPSLGALASEGRESLRLYPYLLFIPALILSFLMLSFNLMADGLRDAFDPRMRGEE